MSSYFVCCFIGNALPVIGAPAYTGMPIASTIFAGMIVLFAVAALMFGVKYTR